MRHHIRSNRTHRKRKEKITKTHIEQAVNSNYKAQRNRIERKENNDRGKATLGTLYMTLMNVIFFFRFERS
jgi:hypothetical protein